MLPSSKIHVAHLRRGKDVRHANTHPFSRVFDGREFVFAHNGTLHCSPGDLDAEDFPSLGSTNSELSFGHLLTRHAGVIRESDYPGMHAAFQAIDRYKGVDGRESTFNCTLSDGEYLAVYRDLGGHKELHRVERRPPYSPDRLVRMEVIDSNDEFSELERWRDEKRERRDGGYVFAPRRLTNEDWNALPSGQLEIVKGGELIYSSRSP